MNVYHSMYVRMQSVISCHVRNASTFKKKKESSHGVSLAAITLLFRHSFLYLSPRIMSEAEVQSTASASDKDLDYVAGNSDQIETSSEGAKTNLKKHGKHEVTSIPWLEISCCR